MINIPPIDELTEKAGDKYELCCVIAKRAKELNDSEILNGEKTITYAAKEFFEGDTEIRRK